MSESRSDGKRRHHNSDRETVATKQPRKQSSSSSNNHHRRHHHEPSDKESQLLKQIEREDEAEAAAAAANEMQPRLTREERERVEDPRSRECPYLDTINRHLLDFDFEKLCSISLSHLNVYACLVCGKYFQGRGTTTYAHTHSVDEDHYVFLNLETYRFYCLPDNYEIVDGSLEDITYLLNPSFTPSLVRELDTMVKLVRAYDGNTYYPGIVGLNNIKANDYCNVVLQLLTHIPPMRNFFLSEANYRGIRRPPGDQMIILVQRFGELVRKLWNPKNFKTHVSPHEFLQAVVLCSKKRFQFTKQGDAVEFLSWLLNALHQALHGGGGGEVGTGSVVARSFRGRMIIYSRKMIPVDLPQEEQEALKIEPEYLEQQQESKFLYLTCDLPPAPLYMDEMKESIIPQVPMATILAKFNGVLEKEYKTHKDCTMKRFVIKRLPPFLLLYIKRFLKNIFTLEKNPTIVNFPIKSLDLGDLLHPAVRAQHRYTTYDLVGNIVHDGSPALGVGTYRVHLLHSGTGKWFEMQDLHVREVLAQMIPLSETLVQVWAVNRTIPNPAYDPNYGGGEEPPVDTDD